MINYSAKEIINTIVMNNPFWEHFICIEGEVKKNSEGCYIEMDAGNTIPVINCTEEMISCGKRKYYGFLNFRDQDGFNEQKETRIDNIHFEMGYLGFVFRIIDGDKIDAYSVKTRMKHKMDVFEHLQHIWCNGHKVSVGVMCSEGSCAFSDVECGLELNDFLCSGDFYDLEPVFTSLSNKDRFLEDLKKAECGNFDVIIVSRGGTDKNAGYGILDDKEVKSAIANMTKLTICAVGHVNDPRKDESFYNMYDFDAKTPSLAGVRLREWLLAFKTIPESRNCVMT